jgi:hypothetical protein
VLPLRRGGVGYIRPNSHKLKTGNRASDGKPATDGDKAPRKPLAAWGNIRRYNLTKVFVDEDGKEWRFCTKCKDKSTHEQGIYNLSHFDSAHVANFHAQNSPEAHLTRLGDLNTGTPTGHTLTMIQYRVTEFG